MSRTRVCKPLIQFAAASSATVAATRRGGRQAARLGSCLVLTAISSSKRVLRLPGVRQEAVQLAHALTEDWINLLL